MGASVLSQNTRGRRRGRRRGKSAAMSEINVTPFVDVMLVLLIIFMVAAPLLTVGVPLKLPETAAAPLDVPDEEPLTIAIAADGRIALQKNEIKMENLITQLRAIVAERRDDKIFLRADGAVAYAQVAQIMGALNAAGFNSIGMVTDGNGPTLDLPLE